MIPLTKSVVVALLVIMQSCFRFSPSAFTLRAMPRYGNNYRLGTRRWIGSDSRNGNDISNDTAESRTIDSASIDMARSTKATWKLHTVTWISANDNDNTTTTTTTFSAKHGELLRTAALRQGVVSPHNGRANVINCRGLGTCGTCAVKIEGCCNTVQNTQEKLRLSLPPHKVGSELRLACQVQVLGDLTVRKYQGFWGQDTEKLASLSRPTVPFGELEYILDNKSNKE